MATSPKITIIIPVYNTEVYLRQCLDSVVNQTLQDIQIICVNDGSTDGSREILQEYANRDSRIEIIDKPNGGASSARNAAYPYIKGKYTSFVDSDDWIELDLCKKTYNKAEETGAEMTIFAYHGGGSHCYFSKIIRGPEIMTTCEEKGEALARYYAVNKLWRTDLLLRNNLYFPEGFGCEDGHVVWRGVVLAERIAVLPECLYYYRSHAQSTVNTSAKNCFDTVPIHIQIKHFLKAGGYYSLYKEIFHQEKWKRYALHYHRLHSRVHRITLWELIRENLTADDRDFFCSEAGKKMPKKIRLFYKEINRGSLVAIKYRSKKKISNVIKFPERFIRHALIKPLRALIAKWFNPELPATAADILPFPSSEGDESSQRRVA